MAFHAAYQYWNLRGVLAERWAHGPTFGSYREGPDFINLLPANEEDMRLVAAYGLRGASLIAEGGKWTEGAIALAEKWLVDAYTTLEPRRTTSIRTQVVGLYPVKDPERASRKLRERFYKDEELSKVVPSRFVFFHAAVEIMALEAPPPASIVVGVYGPPHRDQGFFGFPDGERDGEWWMCIRAVSHQTDEDGLEAPATGWNNLIQLQRDFDGVARTVLPSLVA